MFDVQKSNPVKMQQLILWMGGIVDNVVTRAGCGVRKSTMNGMIPMFPVISDIIRGLKLCRESKRILAQL